MEVYNTNMLRNDIIFRSFVVLAFLILMISIAAMYYQYIVLERFEIILPEEHTIISTIIYERY